MKTKKLQYNLKIISFLIFLIFLLNSLLSSATLTKRISLNLKDTEITDVLAALAKEERLNLVIPPYIKGKVSIFLDNVTIKDAIDIITNLCGYSYYIKDNIIYIDKKKNVEKIIGRKDFKTKIIYVNYAKVQKLKNKIEDLLSKDGKVVIDERTNSLLITDYDAKTVDKPRKQIMIEAKIVVINSDATKQLGLQWGGSFVETLSSNKYFYGIKGGTNMTDTSITQGAINGEGAIKNDFPGADSLTIATKPKVHNPYSLTIPSEYIVNIPTTEAPAGGIGLIFGKWGYYNLSIKLTALSRKNLAKIISSPKVLTLNNQKASIAQGVEIPYKSVSDAGTNTEFKDAKLKLEVTPHITKNKYILLDINLKKDTIGQYTVSGEPTINSQEINTKLLLGDGETAVIGGIMENVERNEETAVPFFSDIPVFGHLFKNKNKSFKKGELLIFITPRIVR